MSLRESQKGMYDVREIPIQRRNRLYLYLKQRLQRVGCSESILLSTSDSMVKDILKILMLEAKE